MAIPWLVNGADSGGARQIARLLALLFFFTIVRAVGGSDARPELARAAFWFLISQAVLFAAGSIIPSLHQLVFTEGVHQHVGTLPRFNGWAAQPAAEGIWALLATGAAQWLPSRTMRGWSVALGVAIAIATLSIGTLAVPAFLCALFVRRRRVRVMLLATFSLFAIAGQWVNPISLHVSGRQVFSREPHPSYFESGKGQRYMPIHTMRVGSVVVSAHWTAYAIIAARGLSCFAENPWWGVGPDRFALQCPVTMMGTDGAWTDRRDPHNQFVAWLAECGGVGLLFTIAALWLKSLSGSLRPRDHASSAVLSAVTLGCFVGEIAFTLPVVALLAVSPQEPKVTS